MNQFTESSLGFVEIPARTGRVYNEAAFHYFLDLELKRAKRSTRPLLLVLVSFRKRNHRRVILPLHISNEVFTALTACVREVDFVGWYRDGLVAAALLFTNIGANGKARRLICARVASDLGQRLPSSEATRLLVRAIELRRNQKV